MVATADSLVEGVHFDLKTTSWIDLGWKALAENVSDIAAMGCTPRYVLVGLGLPPHTEVGAVESLYEGLQECAQAYGCIVVGGDTVRCPQVVLHITVLGESLPGSSGGDGSILTRAAAVPGDLIAVTGPLGASAAGLQVLREDSPGRDEDEALILAHLRPQPRVQAGLTLVAAGVRCGIDVSDGLLADVGHLCENSGVDARIDLVQVPVHPAALRRFGEGAIDLALRGGEDYELICAGSPDALATASAHLIDAGEPPLIVIGTILKQEGASPAVYLTDQYGRRLPLAEGGYQHFSGDR